MPREGWQEPLSPLKSWEFVLPEQAGAGMAEQPALLCSVVLCWVWAVLEELEDPRIEG